VGALETPASPDLGDALREAAWPAVETTLELALMVWWLWLLLGAVLAARAVRSLVRERRLMRAGIYDIDRMEGREFERYLETLFARLGYRVELTPQGAGADLVIEKDRCRTAIQAKRYSTLVGLRAIREVLGAKDAYRCDVAMVVSNRAYTSRARRLAGANDVELWDREQLVRRLLAGQDVAIEAAPDPA